MKGITVKIDSHAREMEFGITDKVQYKPAKAITFLENQSYENGNKSSINQCMYQMFTEMS